MVESERDRTREPLRTSTVSKKYTYIHACERLRRSGGLINSYRTDPRYVGQSGWVEGSLRRPRLSSPSSGCACVGHSPSYPQTHKGGARGLRPSGTPPPRDGTHPETQVSTTVKTFLRSGVPVLFSSLREGCLGPACGLVDESNPDGRLSEGPTSEGSLLRSKSLRLSLPKRTVQRVPEVTGFPYGGVLLDRDVVRVVGPDEWVPFGRRHDGTLLLGPVLVGLTGGAVVAKGFRVQRDLGTNGSSRRETSSKSSEG